MLEAVMSNQEGQALFALAMYVSWHALVARKLPKEERTDPDVLDAAVPQKDEVVAPEARG